MAPETPAYDLRYAIPQAIQTAVFQQAMPIADLRHEERRLELEDRLSTQLRAYEADEHDVRVDDLLLWPGLRHALYALMALLAEPGSEVIIPLPTWPGALEICAQLAMRVIHVPPEAPLAGNLAGLVSERTRAIYLCEPNNPSGARLTGADWESLRDVVQHHPRALLIIDGAFQGYDWTPSAEDGIARCIQELRTRLVYVNTCSKQLGCPNLRIAYVASPAAVRLRMQKYRDACGCVCTAPSLHIALAMIAAWPDHRRQLRDLYRRNRQILAEGLRDVFDPDSVAPQAGICCFPRLTDSQVMSLGQGRRAVASRRLVEYLAGSGVFVLDGQCFGAPGHIRLSFAQSTGDITGALRRFRTLLMRETAR